MNSRSTYREASAGLNTLAWIVVMPILKSSMAGQRVELNVAQGRYEEGVLKKFGIRISEFGFFVNPISENPNSEIYLIPRHGEDAQPPRIFFKASFDLRYCPFVPKK
jgi:hypothetical protein